MAMRIPLLLATFAGLACFAAGCGREETAPSAPANGPAASNTPASAPQTSAITTADLDKVGKAAKAHRLALVVKTRNNPFFEPMIRDAEAAAKALGVELDVQAPAQETDKERQFAIVQDLTARGVEAILITPADSKGIVPALKQAQERGALVINLDNRVDVPTATAAGVTLGGYVGADNEEGGRLAGKAMVEALKGGGKVAVLEGIRGTDNAEARKRGFTEAVQGSLQIAASDTAEWDTQKAYAKFQSMLAANPDLKGLFCANDKMALGAIKAIQEAGKTGQIVVIGYDNIPEVQPLLKSGALHATIEQHPDLMGSYGVKMAVGLLSGGVPKGRELLVPLEVITKDKAR
jgi:ribose transport system substrate-binding protein